MLAGAARGVDMIVHAALLLTHIELAKPTCQRLTVDMNYHVHPL
jgi:hypothetical protein